jgi:hypothetical protein
LEERHKEVVEIKTTDVDDVDEMVGQLVKTGFRHLGDSGRVAFLGNWTQECYFWHDSRQIGLIVSVRLQSRHEAGKEHWHITWISAQPICAKPGDASGYTCGINRVSLAAAVTQTRVLAQYSSSGWKPLDTPDKQKAALEAALPAVGAEKLMSPISDRSTKLKPPPT